MATRKPTSTGRGGTRGATSKKTASKARKSAANASRKIERASAAGGAVKTAAKAVKKSSVAKPTTNRAVRHSAVGNLESAVRSGTATKTQQKQFRATHEAAGAASRTYGAAKSMARAATGTTKTAPKMTKTAIRKNVATKTATGAAEKKATANALRKKKPLY